MLEVDQKPLGQSSRSSPATYTGLFDEIRKLFAATRLAKIRGYKANRFSFNAKGGRCEECQGQGSVARRAGVPARSARAVPGLPRQTLQRRDAGSALSRPVDRRRAAICRSPRRATFFANVPMLQKGLQALDEVGLGYLALGQPANTLVRRRGPARQAGRRAGKDRDRAKRCICFDEPTTGLHFVDVARLIRVFRRLVDAGNTVVVIEHHLDLIAACDWVIDLGPEGGTAGGEVVFAGPPH